MAPRAPTGPFRARRVSFLELWEVAGWRVKFYGLSLQPRPPGQTLIQQGKSLAAERLALAAREDPQQHGLAVLTVHEGENGDYVLVDWWSDNDVLRHYNYGAPKGHDGRFLCQWPGPAACVWELAIIAFERAAWIEHVLVRPDGPDIAAYLAARLTGEV